jgi:uroporphyrinogen-III synthase
MGAPDQRRAKRPLDGLGILITRPTRQAQRLATLIEQQGAKAIRFPTIEILQPADIGPLEKTLSRLDQYKYAIFVSVNAVQAIFNFMRTRNVHFPLSLSVMCIGPAGAEALKDAGVDNPVWPQERFDSEGLLALPELKNISGKRIVIFRGDGGRELLGATLAERGACVDYVECYRRSRPRTDSSSLARQWDRGEIHVTCVTSVQGLRNLYDMIGESGRSRLVNTPIVVVGQRIAKVCRELGFSTDPIVAAEASDEAIVAAIKTWRTTQNSL